MFFDAEAGLKPEVKGCWEGNAPAPPQDHADVQIKDFFESLGPHMPGDGRCGEGRGSRSQRGTQ